MYALFMLSKDRYGRYHHANVQVPAMELGFDIVVNITRQGWCLLQVRYLDLDGGVGNWVDLPTEAFDGQQMSEPLYELQDEWTQILTLQT